ncbi:hypothetical protein FN846DRAFT_886188 [Sphaerosporella brunnea]|uniref:Uncharacterized protein n=1 Tax=Sphaerosporella brunnea TaxID=1250544 RepID=A0A5J5FA65_9PEZI|nr:hypothetical protein FN846DRAFT_886188 [Sphaerosporella brunnea]
MHSTAPKTTFAPGTSNAESTFPHAQYLSGDCGSTDDDDRPSADTYVSDDSGSGISPPVSDDDNDCEPFHKQTVLPELNAHAAEAIEDTRTDIERMRTLIAGFINGISLPTSDANDLHARQYGASLLVLQDPNPAILAAVESACRQSCKAVRFEYNACTKIGLIKMPSVLHRYAGNGFFSTAICYVLSPTDVKRLRVKSESNLCFFQNGYNHSTKAADYAVGPKDVFNPTFVVEVGWSETYSKLQADARLWLDGTTGNVEQGEVRLVALIKLNFAAARQPQDAASAVGEASQALGNPDDSAPQFPGDIIDEPDADLQDRIASGATIIPSFLELRGFIELWRRGSDNLAAIAPPGRIVTIPPTNNRLGLVR